MHPGRKLTGPKKEEEKEEGEEGEEGEGEEGEEQQHIVSNWTRTFHIYLL